MEDACILCNVIEFFDKEKYPRQKDEGFLALSNSKWHWHNHVKTHQPICVDIQMPQFLKGGIDWLGVSCNSSFL
jgi:hypothetical protein